MRSAAGGFHVIGRTAGPASATTPGTPSQAGSTGDLLLSGEDDEMNDITRAGRNRQQRAGTGILAAALAGIAVLAAACGGGPPAGADPGRGQTPYQQALAYARCMRAHGDPGFPDPSSQGLFPHPAGLQYQSASRSCGHLLPSQPLTAAEKQEHVSQALKFSACMRSHGVPSFPDPTIAQGGKAVGLNPPRGIDLTSPQFQAAVHACRKYAPGLAGLMTGGAAP